MGILLVRHGEASPARAEADDADRRLTDRGREQTRLVAEAIAQRGLRFGRFLTSPRVRAVETARIFASVLGFTGNVEVLACLSFTESARKAAEALEQAAGNVAAFGHMPTLSETLALLTNARSSAGFSPSEARWVEAGQLAWGVSAGDLEG